MPPTPDRNDETGALERMRKRLYAAKDPGAFPVPDLAKAPGQVPSGWAPPPPPEPPKKSRLPLSVLFLCVAGGFFVMAAAVAAYLVLFGGRAVSSDRVAVEITGPAAIGSGDTVSLLIKVKNSNPAVMTGTTLSVDFPEGTRSSEDQEEPASRYTDTLGDIEPGASSERTVRAVFFGNENQKLAVPVHIEYRTPGSNAVFVKDTTYEFTMTTSPLSVTVETLSQISSGQPITVAVKVRSNAKTGFSGIALLPQYPSGFFLDPASKPVAGTLIDIGTLAPDEERVITVRGTLSGEDSDQRFFRFTAGIRDGDRDALAVSYTTADAGVTLTKPFLATTLAINRDTSDSPVVDAGTQVQGMLSWVNTLLVPISDGQVTLRFGGDALDTASISAGGGYYRSADTSISFTKDTEPGLANLAPGDTGNGSFAFSTKTGSALAALRNPTVTVSVSVAGRRVGESRVPETIASTVTRTVKVATSLSLSAKALRTSGPFTNTGPWPPRVDAESTYTVVWSFANTVNSVADGTVTAVLPSYVRYTGAMSPAGSGITYNEATRTLTWSAGDIAAGTGPANPKQVAFQVALLPSLSQQGTSPVLVANQAFSGTDRFTKKALSGSVPNLTTETPSDPAYQRSFSEVTN